MIVPKPMLAHARASAMMGLAILSEEGRGSHVYVFNPCFRPGESLTLWFDCPGRLRAGVLARTSEGETTITSP
jgi:hypothetical protein